MKVLVVDDNAIVRAGLRSILDRMDAVTAVQEAGDGIEALEQVARFEPDVVLLDVRMPRRGGLDVLPEIAPRAAVIMLTSSDEPETIQRALSSGASGFLVHGHLSAEDVASALTMCAAGGMALGPEASAVIAQRVPQGPVAPGERPHPLANRLTDRELTVLAAAARGMGNEEIAREQFLSPRTVKNYLNAAYPKIGVHNRAEAIVAWHEALDPREEGRG